MANTPGAFGASTRMSFWGAARAVRWSEPHWPSVVWMAATAFTKVCRGQGLGSLLIENLLGIIDRECASCFLTVSPENSNALKLYRKWGFTSEEFVAGYYRENEDRLVLIRPSRDLRLENPIEALPA